jgi:hypothetical protein
MRIEMDKVPATLGPQGGLPGDTYNFASYHDCRAVASGATQHAWPLLACRVMACMEDIGILLNVGEKRVERAYSNSSFRNGYINLWG